MPELRRKAHLLFILPPRAQASRRCENTSDARPASRQAWLPFRSLDPFRALREPDRRRRDEKRPFPLRTKNCQHNPKQLLDRKSPIQVRIPLPPAVSPRFGQPRPLPVGIGAIEPSWLAVQTPCCCAPLPPLPGGDHGVYFGPTLSTPSG